jgi:hypothetical protein
VTGIFSTDGGRVGEEVGDGDWEWFGRGGRHPKLISSIVIHCYFSSHPFITPSFPVFFLYASPNKFINLSVGTVNLKS